MTPRRRLVEIRTDDAASYEPGQELSPDLFAPGEQVDVTATSKGKGFAGVMKRHGFHGVGASHGAHRNHRKPGSIGGCATPGRVFKGLKMAGRMGGETVTTLNLTVHAVDVDKGLLLLVGRRPRPPGRPGHGPRRRQGEEGGDAMTSIDVLDAAGKKSGSVDLPAEIFDVQVNIPLIHQVVVAQQAAARQGTASTKTRAEVAGGGRKPYRQKGTGRARQGSIRAPQFTGGGVVHGPQPRSYDQRTPKKMKAAALRGALSDRARGGRVHVVDGLLDGDTPSTKKALAALRGLTERPRVLVVLERTDEPTWLSLRNDRDVHLLFVDQLNTYDVLVSDDVVFTRRVRVLLAARRRRSASTDASGRRAGRHRRRTTPTPRPTSRRERGRQ